MKKEWVKLIKVGFMHCVEEPWCNNKGVAIGWVTLYWTLIT